MLPHPCPPTLTWFLWSKALCFPSVWQLRFWGSSVRIYSTVSDDCCFTMFCVGLENIYPWSLSTHTLCSHTDTWIWKGCREEGCGCHITQCDFKPFIRAPLRIIIIYPTVGPYNCLCSPYYVLCLSPEKQTIEEKPTSLVTQLYRLCIFLWSSVKWKVTMEYASVSLSLMEIKKRMIIFLSFSFFTWIARSLYRSSNVCYPLSCPRSASRDQAQASAWLLSIWCQSKWF